MIREIRAQSLLSHCKSPESWFGVKYNMNIKVILLNNDELGKISKEQMAGAWDVWQTSLHNPNFAEYASGCGALGIRVNSKTELDASMEKVLGHDGTALLEIITDVKLI